MNKSFKGILLLFISICLGAIVFFLLGTFAVPVADEGVLTLGYLIWYGIISILSIIIFRWLLGKKFL